MQANTNEPQAARAVAHAVPVGAQMGHGRLDLVQALGAAPASDLPPTGSIDRPSGSVIVLAGQSVFFSGSGSDPDGKITGYSWSFPGGEPEGSNVATPGSVTSELLTWGAGNLSAFWAFARGCDRVMHLQFRAGELGVSLVQVRAKRFEDSRSMRRTEWGQGDTKLLFRGFEISGIL